jgi:hypothetical protein
MLNWNEERARERERERERRGTHLASCFWCSYSLQQWSSGFDSRYQKQVTTECAGWLAFASLGGCLLCCWYARSIPCVYYTTISCSCSLFLCVHFEGNESATSMLLATRRRAAIWTTVDRKLAFIDRTLFCSRRLHRALF